MKLDQYDYAGATAIAVVMLVFSFVLLLAINLLHKWSSKSQRGEPSTKEEVKVDASFAPGYVQ
jgi:ABC-type Fe3+ transport system permease subunit